MICVKCHTLNISLTFSPVHCKTALSLPQSAISLCAGRVRVQESGHKGVGHTNTHRDMDTHTTTTPCVCPILEGVEGKRGCRQQEVVRPFDLQLPFIYECENTNFFFLKIAIYIVFSISSCIFFSKELLAQTGIEKKREGGERGRQTDGHRDGRSVSRQVLNSRPARDEKSKRRGEEGKKGCN